ELAGKAGDGAPATVGLVLGEEGVADLGRAPAVEGAAILALAAAEGDAVELELALAQDAAPSGAGGTVADLQADERDLGARGDGDGAPVQRGHDLDRRGGGALRSLDPHVLVEEELGGEL